VPEKIWLIFFEWRLAKEITESQSVISSSVIPNLLQRLILPEASFLQVHAFKFL